MQKNDEEVLRDILEQFERIKSDAGIIPDEDYQKELEEMFGVSLEEMNAEATVVLQSQTIEIEIINEDAVFPSYNYPTDSGFDLYSVEEVTIPAFGRALIGTGLKFSFSEGYEIQIRPKSGLAINQGLTVLNTPGTVDAGYTGEIKVPVFNTNNTPFTITKRMKIAQAVLCPVKNGRFVNLVPVESISEKDRGDNGFGSTGI